MSTAWMMKLTEMLLLMNLFYVFTDNFFTSFRQIDHLHENSIQATGVIRSSKLGRYSIELPKLLEKKERGFIDQTTDSKEVLTVVGWNDIECSWGSADSNGKPLVSHVIKQYNHHMGSVDRCDQNVSE